MESTSSVGLAARRLRRAPVLRSQTARRDAAALAAMYERHHQALYRYCRSILHDDEDARDALQSTMAKALAALRDEERDFELRPWLFRIAHNEAISRLRQRRDTVDLDAATTLGTDALAQAVEDRERLALLRADLRDLPERQRAALVLRELSGLSHEEIATVLDSSARAVKQTIFEARVSLQDCADGRAMLCADVQRALSDGDGRVLRGRRVRAHVRSCRSCRQFKAALAQRPGDLAALAPALPAAAGAALLSHLLPGAKAAGIASGAATGAGGGVAATVATKTAIIVAATATLAGTTTAVREIVASPQRDARPAVSAPRAPHSRPVAPLGPAARDRAATSAQRDAAGRSPLTGRPHRSGTSGNATKAHATGAAPSRQQPGANGHAKAKAKAKANKQTAHGGRATAKHVKSHPTHPAHPQTRPGAAKPSTHPSHPAHPAAATPATPAAPAAPVAQPSPAPPAADGAAPGNSASAHDAK